MQSRSYRHADPRDLVSENGVAVAGPGGAPQEGASTEELHRHNVRWRRHRWYPLERLPRRRTGA
jgi:hypothetical protein